MTRTINVGDRVVGTPKHRVTKRIGKYGKVVNIDHEAFYVVYDGEKLPKIAYHGELAHADPVAIGYMGSPSDMDLQEGDTLQGGSGHHYTVVDGRVKWDGRVTSVGVLIENCVGQYTLISRASEDNNDLFTIEKPLGLLDAETQKRLMAWDGDFEMFCKPGWTVVSPNWSASVAYRAVPKKTIQYIDRPCHIGYDGEITISSGTKGNATMKGKLVNGQPDGKWTIELD